MKVLVLCFVAALWLQLPSEGHAECCYVNDQGLCNDCTKPTPFCAFGTCNIFGCNCAGGCRRVQCGKSGSSPGAVRSPGAGLSAGAHDVILAADQDGDGKLSFAEARAHLAGNSLDNGHMERLLEAMDTDKDSFLSARELDSNA